MPHLAMIDRTRKREGSAVEWMGHVGGSYLYRSTDTAALYESGLHIGSRCSWEFDFLMRYIPRCLAGLRATWSAYVDSEHLAENCDDPGCLVCLHRDSLVAAYDELPGWMFVLTAVSGGCEVLVFDRERRQRLQATGDNANGMLRDLRIKAIELNQPLGQSADGVLGGSQRRRRGSLF